MESDSHPEHRKFDLERDTVPCLEPTASNNNVNDTFLQLVAASEASSADTLPLVDDSESHSVNISTFQEIEACSHNQNGEVVPDITLESTKVAEDSHDKAEGIVIETASGGEATTNDAPYAVPVEANHHAPDDVASEQESSDIPAPQIARLYGQTPDLQLHCTTEEANFPPLDSVRLVAFGLGNAEGDVLELEKVSRDTWKQAETAPLCEIPAGVDCITIVATSEDTIDFAHVCFLKDELTLGLEANEARVTKGFTSEASGPMLELTFVIITIPQDETIRWGIIDVELLQIAHELGNLGIQLMGDFDRTW